MLSEGKTPPLQGLARADCVPRCSAAAAGLAPHLLRAALESKPAPRCKVARQPFPTRLLRLQAVLRAEHPHGLRGGDAGRAVPRLWRRRGPTARGQPRLRVGVASPRG